jgi:sugar/nucleoside kinase (ribokinase family)
MPDLVTLGEPLVEIMREKRGVPFSQPHKFMGPYPSGAPAIFADAAARLGMSTGFIGTIGQDEFGLMLKNRLKGDGVDIRHLKVVRGFATGTAFVMYERDGRRRFIFHLRHAAAGQLGPSDVKGEYIRSAKFLHIMGSSLSVSESSREACYRAARIAESGRLRISFDPNLRPELLEEREIRRICKPILQRAYVVLPSGEEASMLTGEEDHLRACKELIGIGPRIVALKQGRDGSTIVTEGAGEGTHITGFRVKEIDPTGAGDSYDAAFVIGLLRGYSLRRAATFANAVGALAVTKFGPMEGCPRQESVIRLMASQGRSGAR